MVLIGPPASGKGTQAAQLHDFLGVPTVSTGAMLRQEMQSGSDLGQEAARYLDQGHLLPDELMLGVVKHWLDSQAGGFVLDGFPRTLAQAEAFDEVLEDRGETLSAAIFLDCQEPLLEDRICRRLHCGRCGAIVRLGTHVQAVEDGCPKCEGVLLKRDDDTLETFRERMAEYRKKTFPVVPYYESRKKLLRIRGDQSVDVVFKDILSDLEAMCREGAGC
jgi:adenylate kinase